MKSFKVFLTGKSALKMVSEKKWKGSKYQMSIRNHWKDAKEWQPSDHLGLIYTVDIQAEDVSSAITRATGIARHICDELTAVHLAIIEHPEPQFSIDVDPSPLKREFVQVIRNCPQIHKPLREMDDLKFQPFFEKMDELRKVKPKVASRVTRALFYFRHSLLHNDPIDRFEDAWVSLEVLGTKIQQKFDLSTKQTRKCEGCGKVFHIPDSAAGVDYIIETLLKENLSLARNLRNKRNGIQHGYDSLEDILKDISKFTEVAHRGILAGVAELIELYVGEGIGGPKTFLPIVDTAPMLIKAILYDFPIEKLNGAERYPQLAIHHVETLKENKKEEHVGQSAPLALQVWVKMNNYVGLWDLQDVRLDFVVDSEGLNSLPQIIAQKWNA